MNPQLTTLLISAGLELAPHVIALIAAGIDALAQRLREQGMDDPELITAIDTVLMVIDEACADWAGPMKLHAAQSRIEKWAREHGRTHGLDTSALNTLIELRLQARKAQKEQGK